MCNSGNDHKKKTVNRLCATPQQRALNWDEHAGALTNHLASPTRVHARILTEMLTLRVKAMHPPWTDMPGAQQPISHSAPVLC